MVTCCMPCRSQEACDQTRHHLATASTVPHRARHASGATSTLCCTPHTLPRHKTLPAHAGTRMPGILHQTTTLTAMMKRKRCTSSRSAVVLMPTCGAGRMHAQCARLGMHRQCASAAISCAALRVPSGWEAPQGLQIMLFAQIVRGALHTPWACRRRKSCPLQACCRAGPGSGAQWPSAAPPGPAGHGAGGHTGHGGT